MRERCTVSLEEVIMNTPSGRKPSDIEKREVGKRLRSENRWELLQEKRIHKKLLFLERCISRRFIRYKIR